MTMKKEHPKIRYDKDSRVLLIEIKNGKVTDSDMQGNVVIDYDKNGNIIRLEYYDFNFDNFKRVIKPLRDFKLPVVVK